MLKSREKKMDYRTPIIIFLFLYPVIVIPNSALYSTVLRYIYFLTISLIALVILVKEKLFRYNASMIPLALFILFVFLSALFSSYPSIVWFGAPSRFTGFISYLCFVTLFIFSLGVALHNPERIKKIIYIWLISVSFIAFIGILQYLGLNLVPFNSDIFEVKKSYSTIGNSNVLGDFLVMAFPFASIHFLHNRSFNSTIILSIIYCAILTTLCRTAWVALFIGLIFLFFGYPRKKNMLMMIIIIIVITSVIMPLNDWSLLKQSGTVFHETELALEGDPETGSARFLLWQESLKALPNSLIIGTGPDTLIFVSKEKFEERFGKGHYAKAHNIYLEIGVTLGIPALVFYIWFILNIASKTDRKNPLHYAFYLMIVMYFVKGVFLGDGITAYPLFWVLLGFYKGLKDSGCGEIY